MMAWFKGWLAQMKFDEARRLVARAEELTARAVRLRQEANRLLS